MQKPRPKEAPAPRQQRPTRENRGSNKGASAPFVIPGGEKAAENPAKEANNGALQQADEAHARKASTEPAVIVFGFNEHRIPQAAWFSEAEADLATRAARLMGLRVLRIENDAHRELAARLRQGQVYAADRTFAPAVQREIFDALCELAGPVGARVACRDHREQGRSGISPGKLGGHRGRRSRDRPRKPRRRLVGSDRRGDRERPAGAPLARLCPDSRACAGAAWMSHCCPR